MAPPCVATEGSLGNYPDGGAAPDVAEMDGQSLERQMMATPHLVFSNARPARRAGYPTNP